MSDRDDIWERIVELDKAVFQNPDPEHYKVNTYQSRIKILWDTLLPLKEKVEQLQKDIRNLQSVEEKNKSQAESLKVQSERITKLGEEKTALEQDKAHLQGEIKDMEKENETLRNKKKALESDKKELQKNLVDTEKKKAVLEQEKEALQNTLDDTEKKKEALEQDKENLQKELANTEKKKAVLEQEKEKLQKNLADAEDKKEALEQEKESLQKELAHNDEEWHTAIQDYQSMMRLMYRCRSLKGLVEGYQMDPSKDAEDFQSVVIFVGLLGNQLTFSSFLYDFWSGSLEKKKPLDEDDRAFIKALNSYYKKRFVDFEVIYLPEDEGEFDKKMMRDHEKPRDVFKRYSEIYLPAIMRDAENVEKMMVVKGEN